MNKTMSSDLVQKPYYRANYPPATPIPLLVSNEDEEDNSMKTLQYGVLFCILVFIFSVLNDYNLLPSFLSYSTSKKKTKDEDVDIKKKLMEVISLETWLFTLVVPIFAYILFSIGFKLYRFLFPKKKNYLDEFREEVRVLNAEYERKMDKIKDDPKTNEKQKMNQLKELDKWYNKSLKTTKEPYLKLIKQENESNSSRVAELFEYQSKIEATLEKATLEKA